MQLDVFWITLFVCLSLFLATGGLLLYTVWRFRARSDRDQAPLAQTHGNWKIEFGLVGIVSVLLLVIAVPNFWALFAAHDVPSEEENVLRVNVTAAQWWWKFEYPDLDITTANELHIPVGRAVQLYLRSGDVIHSFWVPRLAGKMDVIPNQDNTMWFKADAAGVYFGQCAEFCGTSHAHMRFRVVATLGADFEAWIQAQQQPARPPTDALAWEGAQLFLQKGCTGCHAIAGTAAQGQVGPDLTHVGRRRTMAAGIMDNTPENLARWLKNPQALKPGSTMPNLGLQDSEIDALVAYLRHLN
jgi:cytochrome c oxidase subunit 2